MRLATEDVRALRARQHEDTLNDMAHTVTPFHSIGDCRTCDQGRRDGVGVNPEHETAPRHD
jgi:hypothetical protein